MRAVVLLLMVTASIASSQWLEQSDWSGGPGVLHPSWSWYNRFFESQYIDWSSIPGQISLQPAPANDPEPGPAIPFWEDDLCSGTLVSSLVWVPMGTDWGIEWGDIIWECWEPEDSEISFRLRTGDDPASMGEWSDPIYESGTYLGDLLPDDILLIQYQVNLQSVSIDPDSWPVVYAVTIEGWYPGGIGDDPTGDSPQSFLQVLGNPGVGSVRLSVSNPSTEFTELGVFDLSGRLVSLLFSGELAGGVSEFEFSGSPGAYLARLLTGQVEERAAFVLIE